MSFPDGPETELPAGDVTVGVVRIGDTVRRPRQPTSDAVAAYLTHLEQAGFDRAPRYLGIDSQGREVLSFLAGDVPGDPVEAWAAADDVLAGVGRLARLLHDASAGYRPATPLQDRAPGRPAPAFPPGEAVLVAQRDITPQNTVFRDGAAWGLIDFDLSDWTTRSLDLANTASHWVPLRDPVDRAPVYEGIDVGRRLRLLLDGYGRDAVTAMQLLAAIELRARDSYAAMEWNAEHLGGGWRRMWNEGVGEVILRRVAWLESVSEELAEALG